MRLRKLDELMVKRGGSVDPSKFKDEVFELLSIPAFDNGSPEFLAGSDIGSSKKVVEPRDVLLSKIVPHIRRCWIVPKRNDKRQIASGEWIQFRSDDFYPDYLRHFLVSNRFHSQFMKTVKGVGGSLLRASPAQVAEIVIPFPPLNDQIRNAHLLGKVEGLIAQRKEQLQQLDDLLKSVFLDMFGDPVRNEMGWKIGSLSSYGSFKNGLNFGKGESGVTVRYLGVGNFKSKAAFNDFDSLGFIELNELPAADYFLYDGDLLFVRSNGNRELVGRCMAVYPGAERATYSGFCIRYRITDFSLRAVYVAHLFRSVAFRRVLFQGGQGANIQNINQQILSGLPIPIPGEGLQDQFAAIVEKVEALKSRCQQSLTDLEALYSALSQQAFEGKLDLSQMALPAAHIGGESPVAAAVPTPVTTPVIELPETDLLLPALQNRTQLAPVLRFWLEAYRTQLGSTAFSLERFIAAAQTLLSERHPDNDFELHASDYEHVKAWVFEALDSGHLKQERNQFYCVIETKETVLGNLIELKASQT